MGLEQIGLHTASTEEVIHFNSLSGDQPFGIAIGGQSQAGKSTLRNALTDEWNDLRADAEVFHFPNSRGFRGAARWILDSIRIDDDTRIPIHAAEEITADNLELVLDGDLLKLYTDPKADESLRAPAVNDLVSAVAGNPLLNLAINDASTLFMIDAVRDPQTAGLDQRPDLIVIDGRNIRSEGMQKFVQAGVTPLVSFILTCDEEIVIDRTEGFGTREQRLERLRERNTEDRNRANAPTSLPEDFDNAVSIHDSLLVGDETTLRHAGIASGRDPNNYPIHIATDSTTPKMVEDGMSSLMSGVLVGTANRDGLAA